MPPLSRWQTQKKKKKKPLNHNIYIAFYKKVFVFSAEINSEKKKKKVLYHVKVAVRDKNRFLSLPFSTIKQRNKKN